ncbi:UNVERIFIED_CONTAM: hypothetical protein QML36_05810 [Aerococcus urinaeequi]
MYITVDTYWEVQLLRGEKNMLTYKVDEEVALGLFNEDETEVLYQLAINSKTYLKECLGWLDNFRLSN